MKYFTIKDIIEKTEIDYFIVDAKIKFIDKLDVEYESDIELEIPLSEAVDFDEEFPATEEGIKEFKDCLEDYIHDNYDRLEDEIKNKYSDTAVEILDISIDENPHLPKKIENYLNDLVEEIIEQKECVYKKDIKMKSLGLIVERLIKLKYEMEKK